MSLLEEFNACMEGRSWADAQEAWDACERGDWMLCAAQKFNVELKKLTAAKVAVVRTVEHLLFDERSINALRVAQDFADGKASREQLRAAADAAAYSAYAAYESYVANVTYYACYVASAAAAYAADSAADSAATAALYAADAAAYDDAMKKYAEIVRKHISFDDLQIQIITQQVK